MTYAAIIGGFVYVAIILDAWSRGVAGYGTGKSIDARLAVAALHIAIAQRHLPSGCVHHPTAAANTHLTSYRAILPHHAMIGSMSRRDNPNDNARAESFMKALKVEAVYPMAFEGFDDVVGHLPRSIDHICNQCRLHSVPGYVSRAQFEEQHTRLSVKSAA